MLLGLSLFYVGAVLILNGLWMLGRVGDREIPVINLFAGGLNLLVALKLAFGEGADPASVKGGALALLFSFTYLWAGINRYTGADGRGLGWFSLFVAISALPVAATGLRDAQTVAEWWLALSWGAWSILWMLFFLLLAQGRPITRLTALTAIAQGVLTGWLPGFLRLDGLL
jgi:hypothetical protein